MSEKGTLAVTVETFVKATLLGRTNGMQYECAYYLNEVLFVSRRSIRG